jgi:hypothetical protein
MLMRPPHCGGLIHVRGLGTPDIAIEMSPVADSTNSSPDAIVSGVRPATAIVLVILLIIITVAGVIQLLSILSPPG